MIAFIPNYIKSNPVFLLTKQDAGNFSKNLPGSNGMRYLERVGTFVAQPWLINKLERCPKLFNNIARDQRFH